MILLKLKRWENFKKFFEKIRKNIENLWQKIILKPFIKISANFILKFIQIILKFQFTINLKYNASKDFETLQM